MGTTQVNLPDFNKVAKVLQFYENVIEIKTNENKKLKYIIGFLLFFIICYFIILFIKFFTISIY